MTVKAIGAMNNKFQGLSTDTKPIDVLDGAKFDEMNTGIQWKFHDGTWIEDLELIYAFTEALKEVP